MRLGPGFFMVEVAQRVIKKNNPPNVNTAGCLRSLFAIGDTNLQIGCFEVPNLHPSFGPSKSGFLGCIWADISLECI